jgi:pimeloyl-ACP methyl ester carboxylesterase
MSTRQHLVLVPGLICTQLLWQAQVDDLADVADVRVTGEHQRHEDIRDIARAILKAAPDRFALAGLSFGGYICFEIMRQAPERIERLALLDTSARPDTADQRQYRVDSIALAERGSRFLGMTETLASSFVHPDRVKDADLMNDIIRMGRDVGAEGFIRQQKAILSRPDSRPTLAAIRCPTLVLVGRQDARTPLALHKEIHAGIPGSELVVVEECGHLSPMERPDEVSEAMRRWLAA